MSIFNGMPSMRKQMKWAHQERMAQNLGGNRMEMGQQSPIINMFPGQANNPLFSNYPMSGGAGANPSMLPMDGIDPMRSQRMPTMFQTGGSIVDYLKSTGVTDTSKAARRQLAISKGFKGDLSAEDNTALLNYLQNQGTSQPASQPTSQPIIENRMAPVMDIDPNTGQPIEMMVNTPQVNIPQVSELVRPSTSSSTKIASRTRPRSTPRSATTTSNVKAKSTPSSRPSINSMFVKAAQEAVKTNPSFAPDAYKRLPDVTVKSYTKKIPNYSRTNMPGTGGTTSKIDFDALRKIQQAFKERKGKVITSSGERKEFSQLTSSERSRLASELSNYERAYKF